MVTPDKRKNLEGTEKPASAGSNLENAEILGVKTRLSVKRVLAAGSGTPPPREPEPETPPTREEIIDRLRLRDQWEITADLMAYLINTDVFKLGKPFPMCKATVDSFTTEQLQLACTLQQPTLLLVPETSFAAKVNALNATRTMKHQQDAHVAKFLVDPDNVSEKATGWKAVIVDGPRKIDLKKGDDVSLLLSERIRNRKAARKLCEKGMDRHVYAMLMLGALRKSEPIDSGYICTLLDDDLALSDSRVPDASCHRNPPRVFFGGFNPNSVRDNFIRFRSSVGGDMAL